ncbi:MAG: DUF349 domain-containing protein [Jiangellaceae bacterium]|nr:DUF349 domain-containing protein [Jiangellaceae bacterium]
MTASPEPRSTVAENAWGRVDDSGDVFVRTPGGERKIGSWQVGEPQGALEFFGRKFDDLAVQVALLEQRLASGAAAPDETQAGAHKLRQALVDAHAIGDLQALAARLDAIDEQVEQRRAQRRAARARALEEARARKEAIVTQAESIAEGEDWRHGADSLRTLLDEWKTLPRLDRAADDALWRRFSSARTQYTRRRRSHFAELAERREQARGIKESLVAEAEQLAGSTDWGGTARRFRELMTRWRAAGAAPKAAEEQLWQRFRAAQDTFFTARSGTLSQRDSTQQANLEVKRALLEQAEALLPVTDWKVARESMRSIHERWEAAGQVPRPAVRALEGRLRRVDEAVREAERVAWRRRNPQARARAEDTVAQLRASISELESRRAAARAKGDQAAAVQAEDALAARRGWLEQAERALTEFGG